MFQAMQQQEVATRPMKIAGSDVKSTRVGRLERSTTASQLDKCKRCGDCGHVHGSCTSAKPVWGRDWRQYRDRRRHKRRARRPEKERCGARARALSSASAARETPESTGAAATDGHARQSGTIAVSKRLRQERGLKEVADESGVGARMKTSIGCCLEKVADLKEYKRGSLRLGKAERLEDVATEGQACHEGPETRRAPLG